LVKNGNSGKGPRARLVSSKDRSANAGRTTAPKN